MKNIQTSLSASVLIFTFISCCLWQCNDCQRIECEWGDSLPVRFISETDSSDLFTNYPLDSLRLFALLSGGPQVRATDIGIYSQNTNNGKTWFLKAEPAISAYVFTLDSLHNDTLFLYNHIENIDSKCCPQNSVFDLAIWRQDTFFAPIGARTWALRW